MTWAVALALAAAASATFWPTVHADLVSWDDFSNIRDNLMIRGFGDGHFIAMLRSFYMGVWQPLGWISYTFIHSFAGTAPGAYHAVNLALHAINVFVFFFVARRLLAAAAGDGPERHTPGAAAAAAMFGMHPLRVETVAWATCQPYLLAAFFCLLSVGAYVQAAQNEASRDRWLAVSVAMYALSLASKSIAVPLPFVLLLLDIYPLHRAARAEWRKRLIEKIPFFALSGATAVIASFASRDWAPMAQQLTGVDRLAISAFGSMFYLRKTLLPLDLIPYNRLPFPMTPYGAAFVGSAAAAAAVSMFVVLLWKRWKAGLTAWLTYLLILGPVLGIVQHGSQLAADRYSYLACMPFVLLLGAGLERLRGAARGAGIAACVGVVCVLAVLTRQQVHVWDNSETLWRHDVRVDPECSLAWGNIGSLEFAGKQYDAAEASLRRATELDARNDNAWAALGMVHQVRGRIEDARQCYEKSAELQPRNVYALLGLAQMALNARNNEVARERYEAALRHAATEGEALQARQGMSEVLFRRALELCGDPLTPRREHLDEAIETVGRATVYFETHKARGVLCALLMARGAPADVEQAVAQGQRAVQIKPDYAAGHYALAGALAKAGRVEQARRENEIALRMAEQLGDERLIAMCRARMGGSASQPASQPSASFP